MQALAEFAGLTYSSNSNMDVKISAGEAFEYDINIDDHNKRVLQRTEVICLDFQNFICNSQSHFLSVAEGMYISLNDL